MSLVDSTPFRNLCLWMWWNCSHIKKRYWPDTSLRRRRIILIQYPGVMGLPDPGEVGKVGEDVDVVVVVAVVAVGVEGAGVLVQMVAREEMEMVIVQLGVVGVGGDVVSREGVGVTRMRRGRGVMIRRWSGWERGQDLDETPGVVRTKYANGKSKRRTRATHACLVDGLSHPVTIPKHLHVDPPIRQLTIHNRRFDPHLQHLILIHTHQIIIPNHRIKSFTQRKRARHIRERCVGRYGFPPIPINLVHAHAHAHAHSR